ncbi:hypothetical protein C0989_006416 [Termitomyces sp. Mn162]|nr:hypothetical protein C0989_006416 [Termitomyces sp. Mn162]
MDQTDFLQHIIAREKIAELSMTSLESRLDDLNEVVSHIRTASKNINSSVSHWESWFNTHFDHVKIVLFQSTHIRLVQGSGVSSPGRTKTTFSSSLGTGILCLEEPSLERLLIAD